MRNLLAVALLLLPSLPAQTQPELVRAVAGPAGRVTGGAFVIDQPRTTFRFPADRQVVIFFEWKATPGKYLLTGVWKRPDGRPASLSDISLDSPTNRLQAYWTLDINPDMESGVWELEVRCNGARIGSQLFSVELPPRPVAAPPPPPPAEPAPKSLDELYRLRQSLVWIRKLDAAGKVIDTATGFVYAPNRIATAFQAVDGGSRFTAEFANGDPSTSAIPVAWHRLQDWAILAAETTAPPLPRAPEGAFKIGERLIVFNSEQPGTRQIGGVDVTGQQDNPGFGPRILLNPSPTEDATGGPLLTHYGDVVGIVGGSTLPGSRTLRTSRTVLIGPMGLPPPINSAATPLSLIPTGAVDRVPIDGSTLLSQNFFTPPISVYPGLAYAGVTPVLDKKKLAAGSSPDAASYRTSDLEMNVYGYFRAVAKAEKITLNTVIFDLSNKPRARAAPTLLHNRQDASSRIVFTFSPAKLGPGIYRVDLQADGATVWRTFVTVTD
jgi:hypothetical protein